MYSSPAKCVSEVKTYISYALLIINQEQNRLAYEKELFIWFKIYFVHLSKLAFQLSPLYYLLKNYDK